MNDFANSPISKSINLASKDLLMAGYKIYELTANYQYPNPTIEQKQDLAAMALKKHPKWASNMVSIAKYDKFSRDQLRQQKLTNRLISELIEKTQDLIESVDCAGVSPSLSEKPQLTKLTTMQAVRALRDAYEKLNPLATNLDWRLAMAEFQSLVGDR